MKKLVSLKRQLCLLTLLGTVGVCTLAQAGPRDNGYCEFSHIRSHVVFATLIAPNPDADDGGCGSINLPSHTHFGGLEPRSIIVPHEHTQSTNGVHEHEKAIVKAKAPIYSIMSAHDVVFVPPKTQ